MPRFMLSLLLAAQGSEVVVAVVVIGVTLFIKGLFVGESGCGTACGCGIDAIGAIGFCIA
jgi:hypothetical protein